MKRYFPHWSHSPQIDNFNEDQFGKERDRLLKFDSLTVLDYIRTSIEILMQMKLEEEKTVGAAKEDPQGESKKLTRKASSISGTSQQNLQQQTPLSSTSKSIELPPKEYEQQLQLYEAEVRNHIKVEQQLKLHIEVLQEKIDDMEKEKDSLSREFALEK